MKTVQKLRSLIIMVRKELSSVERLEESSPWGTAFVGGQPALIPEMIKGEGAEELLDAIEFKIVITPCGRRRAGEVKRADKFNTTAAYHCRARSAVITGQLGSVD